MLRRLLLFMRAMALINFCIIVNLIRCLSIESGVRPGLVVMVHPCADIVSSLSTVFKGVEVNAFVFQTSPKPFDKHVIHPPAFSLH